MWLNELGQTGLDIAFEPKYLGETNAEDTTRFMAPVEDEAVHQAPDFEQMRDPIQLLEKNPSTFGNFLQMHHRFSIKEP